MSNPTPPTPPMPPMTGMPVPNPTPGKAPDKPPIQAAAVTTPAGAMTATPLDPKTGKPVDSEVKLGPDGKPIHEDKEARTASFWADPKVANMAGLATSVIFHAVILVVGIVIAREVGVIAQSSIKEQVIIPQAVLATDTPGGIPNPGMDNDPNRQATQNEDQSVAESDAFNNTKKEELTESLAQSAQGEASSNVISNYGGATGANNSKNNGFGASDGGGKLAKFGVGGGGMGMGPKGPVFGNGGNATKFVFLCDATGTMVGLRFDLVKRELKSTINKFKPVQSYNVVFFQDEGFETVDKSKLLPAIPPNNKKTFDFLDSFAVRGRTNPVPGIEQAFKLKPQVIYILSDGEFDDLVSYDEVIEKVKSLNADKQVKINTILFGDRDQRAQQTLETIASDNGGTYVFVTPDSLLKQ